MSDEAPIFWRAAKSRWILPYKASDGAWAQKYCPAEFTKGMKRQARAWASEWLANNSERQLEPARRLEGISLAVGYERFIAIAKQSTDLAPATVEGYQGDFRAHILKDEGLEREERITQLGVAALGTDYARLKAWYLGIRRRCTSASRARAVFSTMRVFFDEAIVQKWFRGANPFRNKTLVRLLPPLPTKREAPPVIVPLEHAQALIAAPSVEEPLRVRYALAFTSGLRDGEISGLTWANAVLDGVEVPVLEIDQARRRKRAKDEERGPLKTRSSNRTLPLHPAAVAALRWWRDSENGVAFYLGRAPTPSDPVFPSLRYGGRAEFSRPRSAKQIRTALEELELPTTGAKGRPVTMHSTRRTFLTSLERAGAPERDRKLLVGHGIADVTHRHYTADDLTRIRELAASVALVALTWKDPVVTPAPPEKLRASVVPGVVPGVVPADTNVPAAPGVTSDTGTRNLGVPGRTRTCDPRFRNSAQPCADETAGAPKAVKRARRHAADTDHSAATGWAMEPPASTGTKAGRALADPKPGIVRATPPPPPRTVEVDGEERFLEELSDIDVVFPFAGGRR